MFWTIWQWVGSAYGVVLAALLVCVVGTCAGTFTGPSWQRAAIAPFEDRIANRLADGLVGLSSEDQSRITAIRARVMPSLSEVDDTRHRMQGLQALMGLEPDTQRVEQLLRLNAALSRRVGRRMDAALLGVDTIDELARTWSANYRREKALAQVLGMSYGLRKSLTSFSHSAAHATSHLAVWSVVTALVLWALVFGRQKTAPEFDWLTYVGGWGALAAAAGILYAIVRSGRSMLRAMRTPKQPWGFRNWAVLTIGFAFALAGTVLIQWDVDEIRNLLGEVLEVVPRVSDQAMFSSLIMLGAAFACFQALRAWRTETLKLSERIRSATQGLSLAAGSGLLVTLTVQGSAGAVRFWVAVVGAIVVFGVGAITLAERREKRNMELAIPSEKLALLPRRANPRATVGAAMGAVGPLALAMLWPLGEWPLLELPLFVTSLVGFGVLMRHQRRRSSYEAALADLYERTRLTTSALQTESKST